MPDLINFGKGTASDEQDLIVQFTNFVVGICGWEEIDRITDTSSDRDYVFKSRGTQPDRFADLYMRWRGYSNYIYTGMYTRYASSSDYDSYVHNSSYNRSQCSSTDFGWWGFGDEDGVWLVWVSGGYYYSAFTGYLNTYFSDADYSQCACCVGQSQYYTWFNSNRLLAYHPVYDRGASASGTGAALITSVNTYNYLLTYHEPSDRDGTDQGHWPIIMYDASGDTVSLVGELRHCLAFSGNSFSSEDWYTISGTNHKYFIKKYGNNSTTGFGPVLASSGTSW